MRALITGAGGQLGSDLWALIPDALAPTRQELSVSDRPALERALRSARAEVCFNCASYNAVDRAEAEPELAMEVNGRAPGWLAEACSRAGVRLLHFSTNFVFDGTSGSPYTESDEPSPASAYARSKREGELRVLEAMPAALVVRSAGLFGVRGSAVKGGSFPERILRRAREGLPLRVVADQRLNPTYTADLARAAIRLAEGGMSGLVHVVAAGCCSFHELAVETLRRAAVEAEVEPIGSSELAAPAARPLNGCLASTRVEPLRDWREGLAAYLESYLAAPGG